MTASNISMTRKLDRPTLLTGYAGRAAIIAYPKTQRNRQYSLDREKIKLICQ